MIDFLAVKRVVEMVSQSTIDELTIVDGDQSIHVINRHLAHIDMNTDDKAKSKTPNAGIQSKTTIFSPAVGRCLFYVGVADKVVVGDVVAGVLALGVLTPVIAKSAGVVHELLLTDDKVDYGMPLLALS